MADRLNIYNSALLLCKERFLASLTEEREPRRLLDQVWNDGGVNQCLEEGQWFFAMRGIEIDPDPSIKPNFGYRNAFAKPIDWVATSGLCQDEFFRTPLNHYFDETGFWYADLTQLYVRYVSNDPTYGANLSAWPETFNDFVSAHFASKVIGKLSNDTALIKYVDDQRKLSLKIAKSKAAMAEPTKFEPQGNWSKSRMRGYGRSDRGYTSGDLY